MSLPDWHEEPISKRRDRASFDCGEPAVERFPPAARSPKSRQGRREDFSGGFQPGRCDFGVLHSLPGLVVIRPRPEIIRKGLARHDVPVFRLGRLAVDGTVQGKGLGGQLILAAGRRCLLAAAEVGGVAMLIDAKNQRAAEWYSSYGAIPLADAPLTLLLPLATVHAAPQGGWKTVKGPRALSGGGWHRWRQAGVWLPWLFARLGPGIPVHSFDTRAIPTG